MTSVISPTYEQGSIKAKLGTGVIPVVQRFEYALHVISGCPTCSENYKKIVSSSVERTTETTEGNNYVHQHTESL